MWRKFDKLVSVYRFIPDDGCTDGLRPPGFHALSVPKLPWDILGTCTRFCIRCILWLCRRELYYRLHTCSGTITWTSRQLTYVLPRGNFRSFLLMHMRDGTVMFTTAAVSKRSRYTATVQDNSETSNLGLWRRDSRHSGTSFGRWFRLSEY
jgi:hypothetical protein